MISRLWVCVYHLVQYDMHFLLYIRTEPPQGKNRKENQRKVCQESKVLINEDRFTVSATSKEEKTSGSKEVCKVAKSTEPNWLTLQFDPNMTRPQIRSDMSHQNLRRVGKPELTRVGLGWISSRIIRVRASHATECFKGRLHELDNNKLDTNRHAPCLVSLDQGTAKCLYRRN